MHCFPSHTDRDDEFEHLLRSVPLSATLDRDRLMFLAGQRSVAFPPRTWPHWRTVAAVGWAACLLLAIADRMPIQQQVQTNPKTAQSPSPSRVDQLNQPDGIDSPVLNDIASAPDEPPKAIIIAETNVAAIAARFQAPPPKAFQWFGVSPLNGLAVRRRSLDLDLAALDRRRLSPSANAAPVETATVEPVTVGSLRRRWASDPANDKLADLLF